MSKKAKQTPIIGSDPTQDRVIVHHGKESAYDKTARHFIFWFLKHRPRTRIKAFVPYLLKTDQTFQEYNAVIFLYENHFVFRQTVEEAYNDALNFDKNRPSFIRIWKRDGVTNYVCAPECALFGDYVGEMYDDKGHLKQEVKDLAIKLIKEDLLVEVKQ